MQGFLGGHVPLGVATFLRPSQAHPDPVGAATGAEDGKMAEFFGLPMEIRQAPWEFLCSLQTLKEKGEKKLWRNNYIGKQYTFSRSVLISNNYLYFHPPSAIRWSSLMLWNHKLPIQ